MPRLEKRKRLVLLSDLWGLRQSPWMQLYVDRLDNYFTVSAYDCLMLAGSQADHLSESERHAFLLDGGIDQAVQQLLTLEPEPVHVLGFSVGGTIAWKAGLAGMQLSSLFAVSSTRLRYETERPEGIIQLFYADKDHYKPELIWLQGMALEYEIVANQTHTFYQQQAAVELITGRLIKA